MIEADRVLSTPPLNTSALCPLLGAVEKLPRYADDHSGMFETEHGSCVLRADVLNLVAACQGERQ
jgi:hypothetical protein